MGDLSPLEAICVPPPQPDETYRIKLFDQQFEFVGLKRLLGAADFSKAGDRGAGLAAQSELAREAARAILASLTLRHLYERPLTDEQGRVDSVMRVNYDLDLARFRSLADMTVGELKNRLMEAAGNEISDIGRALTGVMAAATAKLMDTHELIL